MYTQPVGISIYLYTKAVGLHGFWFECVGAGGGGEGLSAGKGKKNIRGNLFRGLFNIRAYQIEVIDFSRNFQQYFQILIILNLLLRI